MRAARLDTFGTVPAIVDVPTPDPGPGEVRIAVKACGVDRFDVDICAGTRPSVSLPLIPGHEIAGVADAIGPGVDGWERGDRVVPSLYLVCGACRRCTTGRETICENFAGHVGVAVPGGYAEYVLVPARNLVRLPDSIGYAAGALCANVVGTALHALRSRMDLQQGETVLITGAGGGVGLHATQLAAHLGARVLAVDLVGSRRERAVAEGAESACHPDDVPDAVAEWTLGRGVDAVLELVGSATMSATLESLVKGGRLVIVGAHSGSDWTVDPHVFYRNEWEIRGSRNVSVAELRDAVEFVADGTVTPIVDRRFPLEEVGDAFRRLESGEVVGRDVLVP